MPSLYRRHGTGRIQVSPTTYMKAPSGQRHPGLARGLLALLIRTVTPLGTSDRSPLTSDWPTSRNAPTRCRAR